MVLHWSVLPSLPRHWRFNERIDSMEGAFEGVYVIHPTAEPCRPPGSRITFSL